MLHFFSLRMCCFRPLLCARFLGVSSGAKGVNILAHLEACGKFEHIFFNWSILLYKKVCNIDRRFKYLID